MQVEPKVKIQCRNAAITLAIGAISASLSVLKVNKEFVITSAVIAIDAGMMLIIREKYNI